MFSGKCRNEKGRKKLFALSVVASMVLALGASALTPVAVSAATCPEFVPGKVVRAINKNVYYLVGSQGELKKYINTEALLTWQPNVSRVVKAKAECLKDAATGDDVGYRPGSRIVKFDKKYYAVGPNKTLFELATPAIAKSIYGANWRAYSRNISKAVFSQYTVGTAMEVGVLHNGMLVKKAGTKTVYYVVDGTLRKVVGALSAAARNDVRSLNAKMFATLTVDDSQTVKASDVVVAPESTNVVTPVATEPSVSLSPLPSPQPIPPETTPATTETPATTPTTPVTSVTTPGSWVAYTSGLSGLGFRVYVPSSDQVKSAGKDNSASRLGAGSYSMVMDSAKLGKNIDRIDLGESSDPADTAYEIRAYAEALYGAFKGSLEGATVGPALPKIHCAWPTPSYDAKTLGGNNWVVLSFMDGCTGGQFVYPVYKQFTYAVSKVNGKMNVLFINNSNMDVRTVGTSDLDPAKAVNSTFLDEFLGKLGF